jgi:hypothetical protein
MTKIVGWLIVAAVGLVMSINAFYMLISPRAWFRLPRWIRAEGSLTEGKYTTSWGAIQVRFTGALFLAIIGWVIYESLLRRR